MKWCTNLFPRLISVTDTDPLFITASRPICFCAIGSVRRGVMCWMVWGLVVWYLEGRRTSEILLAGLSCSFILASGVVKDVGRWLMSVHQIDQFWMPCVTGLIFLPPFLPSVWLLNQVPQPTDADVQARVQRRTMDSSQRWQFLQRFLPGLVMLLIAYFFLTAYRDFRDNFGVEIFHQLGYGENETPLG